MNFIDNAQNAVSILSDRTEVLFKEENTTKIVPEDEASSESYIKYKLDTEYFNCTRLPKYIQSKVDAALNKENQSILQKSLEETKAMVKDNEYNDPLVYKIINNAQEKDGDMVEATTRDISHSLILKDTHKQDTPYNAYGDYEQEGTTTLIKRHQIFSGNLEKPEWHAPWKLMRVTAGHQGWVRCVSLDPDNKWYATGSADSTIKVWDLASSDLKLTLTGHIMTVRALCVSDRHPYLFSGAEDKTVKCWDLEKNKVIRDYHGHVGSVYSLDLHPDLDVLVTAGRDAVVRVWDIRTRVPIHVIDGHKASITNVKTQSTNPQIISTSMDSTIRLYDIVAGKTSQVLTHHKKSVRGLVLHPTEYTMATGSSDSIKQWKFPEGALIQNFYPNHDAIVNTMSVNNSNVMFSGADNGTMAFYDWKTGHKFQDSTTIKIPGSLESENSIFASAFDRSGLRLITCEGDKSVKIWKEDPEATPESHPGNDWEPVLSNRKYN